MTSFKVTYVHLVDNMLVVDAHIQTAASLHPVYVLILLIFSSNISVVCLVYRITYRAPPLPEILRRLGCCNYRIMRTFT